ncbi:MAG: tRNA (N6-threonylcarbamoyladenosine(37)-N6)-methyltransferase TrmO [Gammaproteobacteria bacterium]|nr:tRNA (N6-threonylcarbamoyladenosine(37)-N6)-methyltransferase TrmO [Gammaproteobacteria bacterium]
MKPIGFISSPYKSLQGMPIQPGGARDTQATIRLDPELQQGLASLDTFSHIYLIYLFHQSRAYSLKVIPFMDDREHGVFATRAPRRPNPIGLSIVELISVDGNTLTVRGADLLDGTPILDIKPYVEQFDKIESASNGWLKTSKEAVNRQKADRRFLPPQEHKP